MNVLRDDPQQVSLFETMSLIRACEQALIEHQRATQGAGTCTSVGQEAGAAGVISALSPADRILTNHRSLGHLIARGADPGRIFAEVMGKSTGYCKGKSGTLHISARELGVILTSTIVGGELSMAPGVALSKRMLAEDDGIVVCFFGDGAACEGIFHESLNLATMWNLPVLFVCENNQWQAYVHRSETMPHAGVTPWAAAHGMPAEQVDGNDVEAVRAAASKAVAYVRSTQKPMFLELSTYRLRGHFEPDDQAYVDGAELAHWQARDPIARLRGRLSSELVQAVEQRVSERVQAGLAYAASSPPASLAELTTDVYA
ncbi:MAG TPA: thiamine pyrophosphate-dependent dehydrogenase E1 component subunit alpha [Polyangiales bacterium]